MTFREPTKGAPLPTRLTLGSKPGSIRPEEVEDEQHNKQSTGGDESTLASADAVKPAETIYRKNG